MTLVYNTFSTDTKDNILALLNTVNRDGIDKVINYLEETDYFTAPASANGHSNTIGGLAYHSLRVYYNLLALAHLKQLDIPEESLIICALLHDLCKVNFYIKSSRNKKIDGKWVAVDCWEYSKDFPAGHGEKSVFRIMQLMKLEEDEILAIRWHMGGFDEGKGYDLSEALNRPLVLLLHLADMMTTYIDEQEY